MKIYATITPAYEKACERWLVESIANVEPEAEVCVTCFGDIHGTANFQAPDFNRHNIEKNRCVQQWIREHQGETIFVTDADIVYFRPFIAQLERDLGDAKAAFACKGMDAGFNVGQMVLRCDGQVLEFFERVGEGLAKNQWDEDVVNRLLENHPFPCRNLSRLFTDTASWAGLAADSRAAAFSYHATETFPTEELTSLQRKQIKIDQVLKERKAMAVPIFGTTLPPVTDLR